MELELTRGNDAVASQGTAAVQAHGDFYVPGSTTLGIRVTLAASEVEGAAGNAYRLDFQYGSSNLFSYNSITNEFTVIWTETSTVQQIVDALGLVTDRIVLSLIPGTDGTTVMGHGRTEAEVFGGQTTETVGTDIRILFHDGADAIPVVAGVTGVQAYVDVYQPGSTTLGFRVTFLTGDPNTEGAAGNDFELTVQQAAGQNILASVVGENRFELYFTSTATIQQIIDSMVATGIAIGTLLAGTSGTTVMGVPDGSAALWNSGHRNGRH